jgi:signal transduction histidine kinase
MVGIFDVFDLANYAFLNPYSIPSIATAVMLSFLAVFLIYKNPKKMINWTFGLTIASIAWWQLWNFMAYNTQNAELAYTLFTLSFLGINFIPAHLFHYVVLLTEKRFVRLAYLNYIVVIIFSGILYTSNLIIDGVWTYFWGFTAKPGILMNYQSLWTSGFIILSLFVVSNYYFKKRHELGRIRSNQIKYFIVGFFIAIFALTDYLPVYGIEIYPMGFLFLTIFAFFLSYTIIRFRFMDIETAFHKTVAWGISSLSMFFLVAGLAIILFLYVGPLDTLTVALFALFLMYFGSWYNGRVQPRINRVFLKKSFEYQKKASDTIEELSAIYKKDMFAETLLNRVYEIFYPKKIFLMIRRGEGSGAFELYERGKSSKTQRIVKMKLSHPVCNMMHKGSSVIDAGELEFESTHESKRVLKWLRKNNIDILVCLKNAGNVIGFLGLGRKENLKYYNSEEISLLERLSSRLGNELNDTLIQEKLVEKERKMREEVEKEVKKRTKDLEETKMALINIMEDVEETNVKLSRAQNELKSSYAELKELDVKKDEFISIAAHELKTPLTAIHGFSQLLKNDKIMKDRTVSKKYLGIIDNETKRLADMVSEILELSRIDLGTIKFEIERINIRKVLDSVIREMGVRAAERGLKIEYNIEKGLDYIESDRERFIQIMMNLVDNAIKFTPRGKVSVSIRSERSNIHCCVKDTGIGISAKYKERIFQRFYQVDSSYTRKGSGTGLGLSIVKEYIGKLGGRFWVESRFGKGSEFHFTLPIKAPRKVKEGFKRSRNK